MPLFFRFFLLAAPLILAVLLSAGWFAYDFLGQYVSNRIEQETQNFARIQTLRVEHALARDRERIRLIASRTQMRRLLQRAHESNDPQLVSAAERILRDAADSLPDITGIVLLKRSGQPFARFGDTDFVDTPAPVQLQQRLLADEQPVFVVQNGKEQRLLLAEPLYIDGSHIGMVQTFSRLTPYFEIAAIDTDLSPSLETVITYTGSGGVLRSIGSPRLDNSGRPFARLTEAEYPVLYGLSQSTTPSFSRGRADYRGVAVAASSGQVNGTGWVVTIKLDYDEAYGALEQRRTLATYVIIGACLASLLVVWLSARIVSIPLKRLTGRIREFGHLDDDGRTHKGSSNELTEIKNSFDAMMSHIDGEQSRMREQINSSTSSLQETNQELSTTNEELLTSNEELKLYQRYLLESESRMQLAITASLGGYWEWQSSSPETVWLSDDLKALLDVDFDGNIVPLDELLPHFEPEFVNELEKLGRGEYIERGAIDLELSWRTAHHGLRWLHFHAASEPARDGHDRVNRAAGTFTDITARKEAEQAVESLMAELEAKATIDPLTGLWNRHHLNESLAAEIARATRHPGPMSVIALDIDHFKQVNDTHGHLTGDDVLAAVGQTLFAACRPPDQPCRFGGEEFLVMLPETDLEGALVFGERIRAQVAQLSIRNRDGEVVQITTSVGVSQWREGETAEDMLARADAALYRAKQNGRNRVEAELPDDADAAQSPRT